MYIQSTPSFNGDESQRNLSLVTPDSGPYALRYVWMQHRNNNTDFINNYFKNGVASDINVRHMTKEYEQLWHKHNQILYVSGLNGDLLWRVKVLNGANQSIDYIEVWRSPETVYNLMEVNKDWSLEEMDDLRKIIWDYGFRAQKWLPYPTVSESWVIDTFNFFLEKSKKLDNCIINTPLKSRLA